MHDVEDTRYIDIFDFVVSIEYGGQLPLVEMLLHFAYSYIGRKYSFCNWNDKPWTIFYSKQNPDNSSPIHFLLQSNNVNFVSCMIYVDRKLVLVQKRECISYSIVWLWKKMLSYLHLCRGGMMRKALLYCILQSIGVVD